MRVKRLPGLALGFLESVFLSQFFCLPPRFEMHLQAHLSQKAIQVFFSDLDRAEGQIPLAPFAFTCHCLHIFYHRSGEWQDLFQLSNHPRFVFPSAPSRWWNALLPVESIVKPFGATPFPLTSCSPHGSSHLNHLLDVIGRLYHQIEYGVLSTNNAIAFELRA